MARAAHPYDYNHSFLGALLLKEITAESKRSPGKHSVCFLFKEAVAKYMKNELQSGRVEQQKGK